MITDITPFNFPASYLSKATVSESAMGEKSIAASVKIIYDTIPDFKGWYVVYRGEKYILPIRKPQGSIENKSLNATYELTFQHWAVYQLKRYFFAEMAEIGSDEVIPDKYEASLGVDLGEFVTDFNLVLDYYYGGQIRMELNPGLSYPEDKTMVSISKSKIWEVLQQLYDLYAVTWYIEAAPDNDNTDGKEKYIIKVGYPSPEMSHVFRYGFEGGLMKVERQVQSPDMMNVLLGRGGDKNIPYRYFKETDENNVSFSPDPDWIPELANVYMDRLHDINFRYYVQGWKDAHYYLPGIGLLSSSVDSVGTVNQETFTGTRGPRRYEDGLHFAYDRGYTDEKFDPIEYVKDDMSIMEYGELWGCLEDNDDIYPTIQGIGDPETGWGIGRVDQTVDVEQVTSDDVAKYAEDNVTQFDLPDQNRSTGIIPKTQKVATFQIAFDTEATRFTVSDAEKDEERAAYLAFDFDVPNGFFTQMIGSNRPSSPTNPTGGNRFTPSLTSWSKYAKDLDTGEIVDVALLKGQHTYCPYVEFTVSNENLPENSSYKSVYYVAEITSIKWGYQADSSRFANTFDIWIKDLWHSVRNPGETDDEFVSRVWTPILGDKDNETARVVFSSGWLATSEDYEFEILGGTGKAAVTKGVHYDTGKTLQVKDKDGNVTATYQSMWRLTLIKSDADLDSIGLYVPSTRRQGNAGDYFFFVGIDMPHQYVVWAEQRLNNYKTGELDKASGIKPQWAVTLDKIRIQELQEGEVNSLISQIRTGGVVSLQDERLLPAGDKFYVKSMSIEYSSAIYPSLQITLSDDITVLLSSISTMQGEVSALQKQIGTLANIESIVRIIGDKLYLRKDGQEDTSYSATTFRNIINSADFTQGRLGGSGWAIYKDGKKNTVIEVDKAIIRESMEVTELVVHQTEYVGGSRIESAASIKCSAVNPVNRSGNTWKMVLDGSTPEAYQCLFDTRQGTVRNLFKVDDVAYSHTFDPLNNSLKYYKRKVLEIGEDYIVLSNAEAFVDGGGLPEEGDVIIHYGNYTDTDRQYVKVADVIGGGHERYVEGLDSVTASGKEYYFAGKMVNGDSNPEGYRFFVGDRNRHYMEWKDGGLTIRGKLTVDSTIGDKNVEAYVGGVAGVVAKGLVDSVAEGLQEQIDGKVDTWYLTGKPTLTNAPANGWATNEERDKHLKDMYYDKSTGKAYIFEKTGGIYRWTEIQDEDITKALEDASNAQETADGKMTVFYSTPNPPYAKGDLWVNAGDNRDIKVCVNARATGSFVSSDWGLASDYDSTQTVIDGGMITSGSIRLYGGGKDASDANVKAGITGQGTADSDIRIWAGSTMGARDSAPFRVQQDGTLYATAANIEGNIKTPEGGLSNNKIDVIDETTVSTNPVRLWAGDSFENRRSAPFRVYKDGSVFMKNAILNGNITISGDIKFNKDAGYITASVKRPFVTITSSNFSNYFKLSNGSYVFTHDFSYSIILSSVPSSVEGATLYIKYSGNVTSNSFIAENYGNIFTVRNNTTCKLVYQNVNDNENDITGYKESKILVLKASTGYISFTYGSVLALNGTVMIVSATPTERIGWAVAYADNMSGFFMPM